MQETLVNNSISFDLLQKFNLKRTKGLPFISNLAFSANDKRIDNNTLFSVSLCLIQFNLLKGRSKFSHLLKAVSNFKTRGGELHGLASIKSNKTIQETLRFLFSNFFVEASELNPKIRFGLSSGGSGSVGFEDIKRFELFSEHEIEYLNYPIGATFSFSTKNLNKGSKNELAVLLSTFFVIKPI
jgi:hypothetical protein